MKLVKVVHKEVFIDIGNSSIKIWKENDNIVSLNVLETKKILKQLIKQNYYLIILCTNVSLKKWLNKHHINKHIYLFDKTALLNDLKISTKIHSEELGDDIVLDLYYLKTKNIHHAIYISLGSYLYCLTIINQELIQVDLFLGLKNIYYFFLNDKIINKSDLNKSTSTISAIDQTYFKFINFLYSFNNNLYNNVCNDYYLNINCSSFTSYFNNNITLLSFTSLKGLKTFWHIYKNK